MMKLSRRKCLWCLAALLLLLASLVGCQPASVTSKPKVKLTLKVPTLRMNSVKDPEINEAYDVLLKATADFSHQYQGAEVTFNLVRFELSEEKAYIQDCFDTKEATDILFEDFFNMSTYVHTGRVVPLDDIINDAWRQDVAAPYWQMSQMKGKTYMLPYLARQNLIGYYKSMFREAGLDKYIGPDDEIATWSLEEWEEILAALKAARKPHTFVLAMMAGNEQSDTVTMTFLRSRGSKFFDQDNLFNLETPEGIAGLKWLKDNYDKGYYPPQCENLVAKDCGKLFWNKQLVMKMINGPSTDASEPDIGLVNFPSPSGKGLATAFVTGFEVFDNGDPEKIKAAKQFLQFFYGTEKYLDYSAGNLPVSAKVCERYKGQIPRLAAFQRNEPQIVDFTAGNPNWRGVRQVFYKHIQELLRGSRSPAQVAAELDRDCNAAIMAGRRQSKLHE